MRCSVPDCTNETKTKRDGITFHKFPTNKSLRKKWLNILNLSEKDVTIKSVICTIHFNRDDLYLNDEGVHELKSWASPIPKISDNYLHSSASEKVCRICLATNIKLFDIMDPNIFDDYVNVTGLIVYPEDIFPKVVCWECAAKLKTANTLREKALRTHALLTETAHMFVPFITIEHTQKINRHERKLTSNLVKQINKANEYNLLIIDEDGPDVQEEKAETVVKEEVNCEHTEIKETDNDLLDLRHESLKSNEVSNERRKRVNRVFKNLKTKKDIAVNRRNLKNDEILSKHTVISENEVIDNDFKDDVKTENDSVKSETIDVEFEKVSTETANDSIEYTNDDTKFANLDLELSSDSMEFETDDKEFGNNGVELVNELRDTTIESIDDKSGKNSENKNNIVQDTINSDAEWLSDTEGLDEDSATEDSLNDSKEVSQKPGPSKPSQKPRNNKKRGSKEKSLNNSKSKNLLDETMFTITQLTFDEQIVEIEKRKESEVYQNSRLKCDVCYLVHNSEASAAFHAARHSEMSGKFCCSVCKVRFNTKSRLGQHVSTTHIVKYSCVLCKFVTNCRGRAVHHEKFHKGVRYKCPLCPVELAKSTSYFSHLRLNHMNRFACDQCGFCFISEKGVQAHKTKRHINAQITMDGPFCGDCDIRFASQVAYDTHLRTSLLHCKDDDPKRLRNDCTIFNEKKNEKKQWIRRRNTNKETACEVCGEVFTGFRLYYQHFRDAHPGQNRTQYCKPSTCMCEQCGKLFTREVELAEHMNIHTGTKLFKCSKCDETFPTTTKLNSHQQNHIMEQCPICDRWFSYKNCKRHILMVHKGEKPYKCDICEKSVTSKAGLQKHVAHVHNGEPWPKRVRRRAKPEF